MCGRAFRRTRGELLLSRLPLGAVFRGKQPVGQTLGWLGTSYGGDGPRSSHSRCPMRPGPYVLPLLLSFFLFLPGAAVAEIISFTEYKLDLCKPEEAAKKAKWSDPDKIKATGEGLG